MGFFRKYKRWGDEHHPKMLDIIRMLLGLFMVIKGYAFLRHFPFLRDLILENKVISESPQMVNFILYYVTYVHLVGGTLIFLGLSTRLAALFLLPIVFGAVFFVNILSSFVNAELWLSLLVLALLLLFVVIGSGPLSLDKILSSVIFKRTRR